uniref:Uncharacterized protein n=1 Tax=Rhizophora mucronata TaxID=61149 RepID=A0A2P2NP12_RHIMU
MLNTNLQTEDAVLVHTSIHERTNPHVLQPISIWKAEMYISYGLQKI